MSVPNFSDLSPTAVRAAIAIVATMYVGDPIRTAGSSDVDQGELVQALASVAAYALSMWRPDASFRLLQHLADRFGDPATRERMANHIAALDSGGANGA